MNALLSGLEWTGVESWNKLEWYYKKHFKNQIKLVWLEKSFISVFESF